MPGAEHEREADAGAPEGSGAPSGAAAGRTGPAPHWTGLARLDPSAARSPEQLAILARLEQTAGNARIARLLGEVAPPELRLARQAAGAAATTTPQAPGGALLVADGAAPAGAGRMPVGAFLDAVEAAVTEAAAKELGPIFQVVGCPWVAHWIAYYRQRQPGEVEDALKRYAPAAAGAGTAQEYVALVVGRVREGIAVWRATGQVPAVPADSPGAPAGARMAGGGGAAETADPPAFKMDHDSPRPAATAGALGGKLGAGERIDAATSSAVGAAYGADLSNVRVHRDSTAAQAVGGMGARAVTVGRDIAFAPGQYEPGTPLGDALIAHELAHVVQQSSGGPASADAQQLEEDADQAALGAVLARWANGTARRPAGAAAALKPQSCIDPNDEGAIFDHEAEELAKKSSITLHRVPEVDDKPMPVGFKPEFWLEAPAALNKEGMAAQTHVVKSWHVQAPGEEPERKSASGSRFSVEMDEVGEWIVYAKIKVGDQIAYLVRRQEIVAVDEIADEAFKKAGTADYVTYRTLMNQERLTRAGGVALDQSKVGGASISNEGPGAANPAAIKSVTSFKYAVHPNPKAPADKKAVKFRWWAVPREFDSKDFTARTDLGQRTNYKGAFAFYLGEGEAQTFSRGTPGKIEIVCELIDAGGKLVDTARYQQQVMREAQLEQVRQVDKLMKEGAQDYKKIKRGRARGLKAMHLDARRGKASDLTLFVGPSTEDPGATMLVDLTPGAEYVEHEGSSVEDAIKHLEDNNSYGEGQILIHFDGPPRIDKRLHTTGESDLRDAAQKTGIGGLVLAGLGIIAAFTPLAPLAPYLIIGGLGMSAASGGISIADEVRKAKPSGTKIALDVAGIVGSLAGAGGVMQAVRIGSVELAMATAAGRFFIYTGFAFDAAGGILLAADTAEQIEQIRNSKMSEEEKIDAIHRLILNLIVVGGLIAFGAKDVGAARKRVLDLVGAERVDTLRPHTLYTLQALDDEVLTILKKVPVEEFETVAVVMAKDPRRSAALSKAFGEKFIEEIRNNPTRSLDETAEVLGAKAVGAPTGAVGGTRGPDVYKLDPKKGIGGKGGKERFTRGVNSTREGRLHGAKIEKSGVTIGDDTASLEMLVGADTVTVTIDLKKTADLSGGAHATTGGAGSGRIIELVPPPPGGGKWTAKIEIDDALLQENVPFVLGHELDEIADFIKTKGTAGIGELKGQMEAGLFVTWAKRGSKTPPKVTSHDQANAREYLSVEADIRSIQLDLAKKPGDSVLTAKLANRQATQKALEKNMGLLDPEHIELKLAVLRKSLDTMDSKQKTLLTTDPAGGTPRFDGIVDAIHQRVSTSVIKPVMASVTPATTVLTPELIAHELRANPRSRGDFLKSGIKGGHHEARLKEFIAANPEYALVLQGEVTHGGVTYRHHAQYRWKLDTTPPPARGTKGHPNGPGPIDSNWELAVDLPKTTFDDPLAFLTRADRILSDWRKGLTAAELASPMAGPKVIGTDPALFVQFSYKPPDQWVFKSVAIDETWIAAAQKAASTPTAPPAGATTP